MLTEQNGIQVDKFYPPTDWQYSFPEGYTRLEYLESTGTQQINTGISKEVNINCILTVLSQNISDNKIIIGSETSGGQWFGTNNAYYGIGGSQSSNILSTTKQTININIKYHESITASFLNGTTITRNYSFVGQFVYNNYLLFGLGATNYANYSSCKIFSCIIKDENNNLLRNFVPVKRNSDNKPGMYDLVNDVFYVNQGTGEFVMGPELYLNNSQIDIRQKNNTNFVEKYKFNANNELVWANPQLNLSGPVNYSVVGNPTITDNVVSGFTTSDYLKSNSVFPANTATSFEFVTKINLSSVASTSCVVSSINSTIPFHLNIRDGKARLYPGSESVYKNGSFVFSTNTDYWIKVCWDSSGWSFKYSTDGTTYTIDFSGYSKTTVPHENYVVIGRNYVSGGSEPFLGSIDLKETYIKVNDKLWFYGKINATSNIAPIQKNTICRIKGHLNYTEIGEPTINNNIVSDLSSLDYIQINNLGTYIQSATTWKSITKIHTSLTNSGQCIFGNNVDWGTNVRINSENQLIFNVSNTTISADIGSITGSTVLSDNTDYYVKVEFTGTQYILSLSTNGTTWTEEGNIESSTKIINRGSWVYGAYSVSSWYFRGTIDFIETYIEINNELIFGHKIETLGVGIVNMQTQEFTPAPEGTIWKHQRDISVVPPEDNTITLLYGVKSDFSKYSLFGLSANVSSGTYDVYIDDVLYATTASATQTDIDFSTLGAEYVNIGTCTTPEELILHKIVIKPTTSGETITKFRCIKNTNDPNTTSRTQQGLMWYHLELTNSINLENCVAVYSSTTNSYSNLILYAVTCKGDTLNFTSIPQYLVGAGSDHGGAGSKRIDYLPQLNTIGSSTHIGIQFGNSITPTIKRIRYVNKDTTFKIQNHSFRQDYNLEQICINNTKNMGLSTNSLQYCYYNTYKLKQTLNKLIDFSNATRMDAFLSQASELFPEKLDLSSVKNLTILHTNGTSTYPMRGLRGLKVSNEAPFSSTSSPQINVSYTGLDRDALVELFNSMPYNVGYTEVGTPTISSGVVSGFSANDYLQLSNLGERFSVVDKWEMVVKINTSSTHIGQVIFGDNASYGTDLRLNSENKLVFQASNSDSSADIGEIYGNTILSDNIDYYIKIEFTGTEYNLYYSTDNSTWNLEGSFSSSTKISNRNTNWLFGMYSVSAWYFRGSINLNSTYIKLYENNEWIPWFTGKAARASNPQINITAATGNNLTKVGSPTIDSNGVVSGFSSSNYFDTGVTLNPYNQKIKIKVKTKITTGSTSVAGGIIGSGIYGNSSLGIFITSTRKLTAMIYYLGSTTKNLQCNSSITCELNSTYYAIAEFDLKTGKFSISVSTDNINWTTDTKQPSDFVSFVDHSLTYRIGRTQSGVFNGSIDLEQTYIKVGQNYIMKGYLTNNDRLIATNKGWTITG